MKNYILLFIISLSCLISCNKNNRNVIAESTSAISEKIKIISQNTVETIVATKDSITKKIINSTKSIVNEEKEEIAAVEHEIKEEKLKDEKLTGLMHLKKFLDESETGQTLTQKELVEHHNIPKEGVKLIKSITKTAENEIEIKWNSTWLIEKISDAKFKDAKMKVTFRANKMYTSGKAIGIKHNKKIYNDLIIIGNSAYIPSVKGYHWKIGK